MAIQEKPYVTLDFDDSGLYHLPSLNTDDFCFGDSPPHYGFMESGVALAFHVSSYHLLIEFVGIMSW